jgi:hypothetical protein
MNGHDTMMTELIQLSRCDGVHELNAAYEHTPRKLDGHPLLRDLTGRPRLRLG